MNDPGDLIGYIADDDSILWPDDIKGFILYRTGERRFIRDLVPNDPEWKLFFPTAINNRGEIAGFGRHKGRLAIYLLTPEQRK